MWQQESASGLLLPVMAAIVLSSLGLPWLAFADPRRRMGLASRWTIFAWLHPFWATLVVWAFFAAFMAIIVLVVDGYGVTSVT